MQMNLDLERYGNRVYVSDKGYVCIAQITPGEDDSIILLAPDEVESLVDRLNEAYQEALDHVPPQE